MRERYFLSKIGDIHEDIYNKRTQRGPKGASQFVLKCIAFQIQPKHQQNYQGKTHVQARAPSVDPIFFSAGKVSRYFTKIVFRKKILKKYFDINY